MPTTKHCPNRRSEMRVIAAIMEAIGDRTHPQPSGTARTPLRATARKQTLLHAACAPNPSPFKRPGARGREAGCACLFVNRDRPRPIALGIALQSVRLMQGPTAVDPFQAFKVCATRVRVHGVPDTTIRGRQRQVCGFT